MIYLKCAQGKQLKDEDVEKLIDELRKGDFSAANTLILSYLGLAISLAKPNHWVEEFRDDIISVAVLRLVISVNKFSKTNGPKNIKAWIYSHIRGAISGFFKAQKKHTRYIPPKKQDNNFVDTLMLEEILEKSITNDIERIIIGLKTKGYTNVEVARILGYSRQRIHQIITNLERRFNTLWEK